MTLRVSVARKNPVGVLPEKRKSTLEVAGCKELPSAELHDNASQNKSRSDSAGLPHADRESAHTISAHGHIATGMQTF